MEPSEAFYKTTLDIISILGRWKCLSEAEKQKRIKNLRPETYYNGEEKNA